MTHRALHDITVLLVAPSKVAGAIIKRQLIQLGVNEIRITTTLQQTFSELEKQRPVLLISSLYFEDGDGLELVAKLRECEGYDEVLLMMISGEDRFEMLDPIRQSGVVAVLPKPFDEDDLLLGLNHCLGVMSMVSGELTKARESRVLVVDDSYLARKHMLRVLLGMGVALERVSQAENGREAISLLEKFQYDLVLTDYNMPAMDGEQLLRYIRQHEHEGLKNLPVIMLTSEQCETKLASVRRHGVTAMLDKPFDPPHLQELLEQYCLAT